LDISEATKTVFSSRQVCRRCHEASSNEYCNNYGTEQICAHNEVRLFVVYIGYGCYCEWIGWVGGWVDMLFVCVDKWVNEWVGV